MVKIIIDADKFKAIFPAFKDVDNEAIMFAYDGAESYIATTVGAIGLTLSLQTRGVYLATAHCLYMSQNPDEFRQLSSATEGSASAGFTPPPTKDLFQYYLSLTPYGLELLAILAQVQPPTPDRPNSVYPYYNTRKV